MNERAVNVLELNIILQQLAEKAVCQQSKEKCMSLEAETCLGIVDRLLKETDDGVKYIIGHGHPPISPIKTLKPALMRAEKGGILAPFELLNIAHSERVCKNVKKALNAVPHLTNLTSYADDISTNDQLSEHIIDIILSPEEIADHASQELLRIRRKKIALQSKIKDSLNDFIKSPNNLRLLQEPIITIRNDRYTIPVKAEYRSNVAGIVHDASDRGKTLFVEPAACVEANNEIKRLEAEENQEIQKILTQLTEKVEQSAPSISQNYDTLIQLDIIFAKSALAVSHDAIMPIINQDGIVDLRGARHPLLDKNKVVPTDISLGKDFDTLVITGPNTGGKTVALKTLGLFCLMCRCGMHIGVKSGSIISVFTEVYADIGDEQSILQSLSTFSSHITNIIDILNKADHRSLILFDELGAGTDPVEGAALAIAILEKAQSLKAKVVATTHYSEVKLYAIAADRVENAASEFDSHTLSPTYRLLIGALGKSNAFLISKRLGLSDDIIENARSRIDAGSIRFEDVASQLEADRLDARRAKEQAQEYQEQIRSLKEKLEKQSRRIENEKERIIKDAKYQAREIIKKAKAQADHAVAQLKAMPQQAVETRTGLKHEIDRLDGDLSATTNKPTGKPVDKVKIGDQVYVTNLQSPATVTSLPDDSGQLTVSMGIITAKVQLDQLTTLPSKPKSVKKSSVHYRKNLDVKNEIDLRGQLADEAELNVLKYLDDAALSGHTTVTIIHGMGTGVLRNSVTQLLKGHPHVKKFRPGGHGEGGLGVTIVTL